MYMEYNIVVVDDDPMILDEARRFLTAENMHVVCVNSGVLFLKYIEKNNPPDLVLLDILMPELDGFDTYISLRRYEEKMGISNTPVIFISGDINSDTEEMGLVFGASDVILKPFRKETLVRRIGNAIKSTRRLENLTEEASYDKLTGFLNKAKGMERVAKLCKRKKGALVVMDLDSFKLVNDLFGHKMGDDVLKTFAKVASGNSRETDTICRIGGDEFMAFFEDLSDEDVLGSISSRINAQLLTEAKKLMGEDFGIPLGVSMGAVMVPDYGRDIDTLFGFADGALYKVKQNGKHGWSFYKGEEDGGSRTSEDQYFRMDRIIKTLEERNEKGGALVLGKDAFTAVFRFLLRCCREFKESAGILLFELRCPDDEEGIKLKDAARELGKVLEKELRVSDIIMQSTAGSFFVMLPRCSEKEMAEIAEQIVAAYGKGPDGTDVKLTYVYKVLFTK